MVRVASPARLVVPVLWLLVGGAARAATPAGDDLDDPKLARRLGARVTLTAPAGTGTPARAGATTSPGAAMSPGATTPPGAAMSPGATTPPNPTMRPSVTPLPNAPAAAGAILVPRVPAPAGATAPPAVPSPPIPTTPADATVPTGATTPPRATAPPPPSLSVSPTAKPDVVLASRPAPASQAAVAPSLDRRESGRVPSIGLGYRRFSFIQVGATTSGSTTGIAVSEPFDSISLDIYPVSRLLRFGLSTQYGWQSGRFSGGNGDYLIAQSASLGIQLAGPWITPFAEAFAGGGYMRRFQFDRTIPTAFWQFGLDVGANVFLPEHGFVSLAVGYLRPVNGFAKEQSFASVYVDTWSVKLGFGL